MDKVDAVSLVLGIKSLTSTCLSSSVTHLPQHEPGPDGTVPCVTSLWTEKSGIAFWDSGGYRSGSMLKEQKVQNRLCPVGEDGVSDRMQ